MKFKLTLKQTFAILSLLLIQTASAQQLRGTSPVVSGGEQNVSNNEFMKNGYPCLSGVCLFDEISSLPKIKWERAAIYRTKFVNDVSKSEINNAMALMAPQSMQSMLDAAPYVAITAFDNDGVNKLSKIGGFCLNIVFRGSFKSESGFLTLVLASIYPSSDGQHQSIRVQKISRDYPEAYTSSQLNEIKSVLKTKYSTVEETSILFGSHSKGPRWYMLSRNLELEIAGEKSVDLIKSYPGCKKTLSIN